MKALDRYLQKKRILIASRFIQPNSVVLDIGCSNKELFESLKKKMRFGVGLDPALKKIEKGNNYVLHPGLFPGDVRSDYGFDVITMLAVIEHLPEDVLNTLDNECKSLLNKNGIVIITTPSPLADIILAVLKFFRFIDGISLEEHHGFKPNNTLKYFSQNFTLIKKVKFQLGLNYLFVFKKCN